MSKRMAWWPVRWIGAGLAALLLVVIQAEAAHRARIIVVETMDIPAVIAQSRALVGTLGDLGYDDVTVLKGEGNKDVAIRRLKQAVSERKPDIVVAVATLAAQAARSVVEGTDIPLVFCSVSDPVGAGLVAAVGEPTGTRITGRIYTLLRDLKIDLAVRLAGQVATTRPIRFGIIHSDYPASMGDVNALKAMAAKDGRAEFISYAVPYRTIPEGLPAMLEDAKAGIAKLEDKVDFWWSPAGPIGDFAGYVDMLRDGSSKPVVLGGTMDNVRRGALFSAIPNLEASGAEVAKLVDDILNGLDPGAVPVVPPGSFDVGINLTTAINLGIVIPPDIVGLAKSNVFK